MHEVIKMTFKEGLLKARSHIVFLLGLGVAFGLVIILEKTPPVPIVEQPVKIEIGGEINVPGPVPLSEEEMQWARTAWQYFENNYQETTGLINSVQGFPATTMWDTASYLMALIGAERLQIISRQTFDERLERLLQTFSTMKLYDDQLPNKSYNTQNASMVDYQNKEVERGIGWSAIDIGRLLVPFNVIVWRYPEHTSQIRDVLLRWNFDALLRGGQIFGGVPGDGNATTLLQEGRLGYEEYAAKSFTLLGKDVSVALLYDDYLSFIDVYGVQISYDSRAPEEYEAHNYVVSEPYILDGIEFGWDRASGELARRVFSAQQKRFEATGILTAVSEDHIDQAPYFVYNTVFTDGKVWNCITEDGRDASEFKTISTKAVIGWHMLYRTPYTQKLTEALSDLHDPQKGWYSGRYEKTNNINMALTCNTNAIVLEALCYKQFGKFFQID